MTVTHRVVGRTAHSFIHSFIHSLLDTRHHRRGGWWFAAVGVSRWARVVAGTGSFHERNSRFNSISQCCGSIDVSTPYRMVWIDRGVDAGQKYVSVNYDCSAQDAGPCWQHGTFDCCCQRVSGGSWTESDIPLVRESWSVEGGTEQMENEKELLRCYQKDRMRERLLPERLQLPPKRHGPKSC